MDACRRRLGVPAVTTHWIAHLDDQGPTAVRSPWMPGAGRATEAWALTSLRPGRAPTSVSGVPRRGMSPAPIPERPFSSHLTTSGCLPYGLRLGLRHRVRR